MIGRSFDVTILNMFGLLWMVAIVLTSGFIRVFTI